LHRGSETHLADIRAVLLIRVAPLGSGGPYRLRAWWQGFIGDAFIQFLSLDEADDGVAI